VGERRAKPAAAARHLDECSQGWFREQNESRDFLAVGNEQRRKVHTRPATGVPATTDLAGALMGGHEVRNLLPGENLRLRGRRVMGSRPWECLWILASHGSAAAGQETGALPKRNFALAVGEGVEVTQTATSLGEGEVGGKAKGRIGGREGSDRYDIADGEQDVDWKREQGGGRHIVYMYMCQLGQATKSQR
jgi:hypothetical protein